MKNNPTVLEEVTNGYHNEIATVVHAEWQMNRFFNTLVDNTPSEGDEAYDIEYFPIESITENNRPTSGICKAMVGQALVEPTYRDTVPQARFYTVDADDEYKYWQSPKSAGADGLFPIFNAANFPEPDGETYVYDNLTSVRPTVTYITEDTEDENGDFVVGTPIVVEVNKITFTVENTFAYPVDYDVQVQYEVGGVWTTIASDLPVPADGKVELWYNGTDWETTKNLDYSTNISAVRLVVRSMNTAAFFNLIELGACLELDLSADVESWNDAFNMGERDFITPLGNISSNGGEVTLWNGNEGTYRNNNAASRLAGLLDKGVIFRCWTAYGDELVQEFKMFSDTWDESDDATSVSLVDESSFFMETKPRPVLYRNITVQEAIWRICDIIGFNNYEITTVDETAVIDIFWTDGEKTAWEIFGDLSRATQTAVYFDSFGVLQVKTRDAAWNQDKASSYNFIKESVPGGQPSNIESLSESTEYEANKVKVNWQQTGFSETRDNIVPFEVVWEPDGDTVLRSTELSRNLPVGSKIVNLKADEGRTWPWNGVMNIEGEYIAFDAKRYIHYDADGVRRVSWVKDYEQQQKLDEAAGPFHRHLNQYTGSLRVAQRGLYGTEEKNHFIDLSGWTKTRKRNYAASASPCAGIRLNRSLSSVTITGPATTQMNDYTYLWRGNAVDTGYRYLGFRMKIDKTTHTDKCGGMFFNGDGVLGNGYFLEVTATAKMNGKVRAQRNEVRFYSMNADGSKKVLGGQTIRLRDKSKNHPNGAVIKRDIGARLAVPMGRYIDFDIWFEPNIHRVQVFANGRLLFTADVPSAWRHSTVSRMGLFARGNSSVTFDYVYGIASTGVEMTDSESYFDRMEGGYYSTQAKDWTFDTRRVRRRVRRRVWVRRKGYRWRWVWKRYTQRYRQRFYDEFGPIAHEIRDFDVKFTSETPVLESKLYFSNDSQAVCTEFAGDITGARFTMANISREPAVINGDDERTAMGNGTINHKLFVYGRPVIQKDAQSIEKEDEWAIRRRGPIEVEYSSPWIQNEAEAERFATWLTENWSRSDSTLEVSVFGNPLIELTDVVHVKYDHIDAYFYVVGISNAFEGGLTTNLTLRKVHNA